MEQDIRSLLHNSAEDIAPDRSRRGATLRIARRRRVTMVGATFLVLAGIAVGGPVLADAFDRPERPLPPVERPEEDHVDEEEPDMDIFIAEARDGSWKLLARMNTGGGSVCLTLEGVDVGSGCVTPGPKSFLAALVASEGEARLRYAWGIASPVIMTLDLVLESETVRVRLHDPPAGSGLPNVRFFATEVPGNPPALLVGRDARGEVVERRRIRTHQYGLDRTSARSWVAHFMERRIAGAGAERFLDADGRAAFADGGSLAPLYPEPRLQDFGIEFVDDLGDGTFEVGVKLIFERGSYGHTYFVHRAAGRLVISGGRSGLEGP